MSNLAATAAAEARLAIVLAAIRSTRDDAGRVNFAQAGRALGMHERTFRYFIRQHRAAIDAAMAAEGWHVAPGNPGR